MDSHYRKEDVVKDDFLFVSYKHEDSSTVTEVIDYLLNEGVRLWYDTDLRYGEKWADVAEKLIGHEHCVGVLFFNSEDSFRSTPVHLERGFALEKAAACTKKGQQFLTIPVNIGKPSTMQLLKAVFDSLPDDDKEMEKTFPLEYISRITALFGSDVIYCYADPDKSDEYKQKLLDNIKKAAPSIIDKTVLSNKEIKESLGTARASIPLGLCKGKPTDMLPEYFMSRDQRVEYQGSTYIVDTGCAYETQRITWRPVYCDDEQFVLLSQEIIDTRNGGDALKGWLEGQFAKVAFTDHELEQITSIRLLTESDIQKSQAPDLLSFDGSDAHWWLDAKGAGALQKVVKKDGSIYNSGYNFRTKKSGVRPVICVKKDYISSLK